MSPSKSGDPTPCAAASGLDCGPFSFAALSAEDYLAECLPENRTLRSLELSATQLLDFSDMFSLLSKQNGCYN